MQILEIHKVPENIEATRIYDYCTGLFSQLPSRKSVKKGIERGEILLNGTTTGTGCWLKGGERIELVDPERTPPKTYAFNLEVHFEDDHLAVIFKPAGLLTSGNTYKTVTNALMHNLQHSEEPDALPWPLTTHRLDKATSGLLIVAKTRSARINLGRFFESGRILKTYHSLVIGALEGKGEITDPIEGKTAFTVYRSLEVKPSLKSGHLSLVQLQPTTGRRHQLRKHLSGIGHSILGDPLYSPEKLRLKHKGLFLSATRLEFNHPVLNNKIQIEAPIPDKFIKRLNSEEKRWVKYNLSGC